MDAESKTEAHDKNVGEGDELNAINNHLRLAPAAKPQIAKRVAKMRRPASDMSIDGILSHSKREDEGPFSTNQSLSHGSPAMRLPPDLEEVEMHRALSNQKIESPSLQLNPEWRELAQIAVKYLSERSLGRLVGVRQLVRDIIHERITATGSEKLKKLWQRKSKLASFADTGYIAVIIPLSKHKLFRQYQSELLAIMLSEENVAIDLKDVDEERKVRIGMSVLQGKESFDGEQKRNVDGNHDEGQEYSVSNDDKAEIMIHSTKENELNTIDNHLWLVPATKPQITMRVAETRRPTSDTSIDGILNYSKREDDGRRSANQSLADDSPATQLPPDLQELARLVAECMDANSNEICHETLALRVLSSECQMLKDR